MLRKLYGLLDSVLGFLQVSLLEFRIGEPDVSVCGPDIEVVRLREIDSFLGLLHRLLVEIGKIRCGAELAERPDLQLDTRDYLCLIEGLFQILLREGEIASVIGGVSTFIIKFGQTFLIQLQ